MIKRSMSLGFTYRWHGSLSLEAPPDSIIDSFWLSPIRVNTFVSIALVTVEALCAY